MQWAKQYTRGFTIVELLIVIVVIAILAAITIVAYNGIQERTRTSSVQSNLSSIAKALETARIQSSTQTYPAALPAGVSASNVVYEYNAASNDYCLQQSNGSIVYFTTARQKSATPGRCEGLIGWWPFNGTVDDLMRGATSTNVSGASGTGQNGKPNSAWYQQGDTTPRYVQTDLLFSPQNFTASIWYQTDGNGPSSFSSIMSNARDCCTPYIGFQIDYNRTTFNLVGRLWAGGTGPQLSLMAPAGVVVGQWQHVAITYNGSQFVLYLNGQQAASGNVAISVGDSLVPMKIGGMGSTTTGHTFGGSLDDARIYNRALSATEIAEMYKLGAQ